MRKIFFTFTALTSLLFTGCLKDEALNNYFNMESYIINPLASWPRTGAFSTSASVTPTYSQAAGDKVVKLYARISSNQLLGHDLTVTFVKDQAAIDAYNTKFNKAHVMMPDAAISMASMQVVIPAGQKEASIPITIKPAIVPQRTVSSSCYMLSFTITDAQGKGIASNYKTILLPFKVGP